LIFIEDHYTGRYSPSVGRLTIAADFAPRSRAQPAGSNLAPASRVVQITIDRRALKKIRSHHARASSSQWPFRLPQRMSRSVLLGSP
jgi:hypothetical protein